MFHQPRRTRASRGKLMRSALLPEERILAEQTASPRSLSRATFSRSSSAEGFRRAARSPSASREQALERQLSPSPTLLSHRPPSFPRFWRGGVAVRERAALLVAGQVKTRVRRHADRQSPFAHPAHPHFPPLEGARDRRVSGEGATPRRVRPAIDPKCHPPNGPIRCGSASEEPPLSG